MASSLTLLNHNLTSPLPCHTPRTQSSVSQCVPILSKSSKSQFYGLNFSYSSSPSIPSFSSFRTSISAQVNKGSVPPPFTLKDQDGKNVNLSKFKGKPVVVYFYPADETPGCTKEACAFRDSYEKFKKAGAEVIGISGDSPSSHKAFANKYRLPFTLLSDEGNKVGKEWGVRADLFGMLPGRQTYVLDKKGVVQLIYNNQFQPEKHIDETLKVLKTSHCNCYRCWTWTFITSKPADNFWSRKLSYPCSLGFTRYENSMFNYQHSLMLLSLIVNLAWMPHLCHRKNSSQYSQSH
ncbi:peroxiredoxin Q, chloroplastic [Durio zibethinus]|uniref:Peroxiredoxin Q, chloroplastic n=1 Tax=Durio zibethinus TaxID=66656 RepID=A0A6P5ZV86_DURZI|nr:peroxiredoxin Q, chloroplastic [Durio zibethinus]